jgi:ABC-type hemin transport system ATPase subunit
VRLGEVGLNGGISAVLRSQLSLLKTVNYWDSLEIFPCDRRTVGRYDPVREPTAGMTIAETARTADLIKNICFETGKTILAIEHDMHFVRRLDCHVVVMMRGRIFREGRYEALQADPAVRTAYLGEVETC